MASEEMDRALTRVKNTIKKLSAKGGVKIASEVWDVNEALAAYQGAVEEVLKRYEDVAQEAADEEALARLRHGDGSLVLPGHEVQTRLPGAAYGKGNDRLPAVVGLYRIFTVSEAGCTSSVLPPGSAGHSWPEGDSSSWFPSAF